MDHPANVLAARGFENREGALDIGFDVLRGRRVGVGNADQGREVEDRIHPLRHRLHEPRIGDISEAYVEVRMVVALQETGIGTRVVLAQHRHQGSLLEQGLDEVGADEAAATRHQHPPAAPDHGSAQAPSDGLDFAGRDSLVLVISTRPLKKAPSEMTTRGAEMFPSRPPVARTSTRSVAWMSPTTRPSHSHDRRRDGPFDDAVRPHDDRRLHPQLSGHLAIHEHLGGAGDLPLQPGARRDVGEAALR